MRDLGVFSNFVLLAFLGALAAAPRESLADIYKWVDEQGAVHFTNDPYEAKSKGAKSIGKEKPAGTQTQAEPAAPAETAPAAEGESAAPAEGEGSVTLVGDIEFEPSESGRAIIVAKIKNGASLPVRDIWIDVMLFKRDGSRFDYTVPFTGGSTAPDRLTPGETGTVRYETDLAPEEVFANKYRVQWRKFDMVEPPKEGEKLPEGVFHKVIKKEPKQTPQPAQ